MKDNKKQSKRNNRFITNSDEGLTFEFNSDNNSEDNITNESVNKLKLIKFKKYLRKLIQEELNKNK